MRSPGGEAPDVAVTGAAGFLGAALCRHLAARGHGVRGLVRRPAPQGEGLEAVRWYHCSLPEEIDETAFDGEVGALVHCAYETRFRDPQSAWRVNVEGSRRLFEIGRARGVGRIVFISSFSAHPEAVSVYGRSKLAVEALLDPERDLALRPGHIIGEGGVFWRTARSIRALPFIPLFDGGRQPIQTVALGDVCQAVGLALEKRLSGVLKVAEPEPLRLRDFYAAVAQQLGRSPRFLRLPGGPSLWLLRAFERLGFRLPLSSDNLEGLRHLRAFDTAPDLERLGLRLRTAAQSLSSLRWSDL